MRTDLRRAIDPVAFATEALGITPDPWQARALSSPARQMLFNCSRQSGKSTTAAVLALHTAVYRPDSLVLLVSPSLRQSSELFRKVTDLAGRLEPRPALAEDNRLSLTIEGGGRVVSLPGSSDTIRGFSAVSLLIEDEAAYVDDGLYHSVRPMLAVSNGRLVLMSTPKGQRGHFFEEWTSSREWERLSVKAADCPRISPEFLAAERAALGTYVFAQEYEGEFKALDDQLFTHDLIAATLDDAVQPFFGGNP